MVLANPFREGTHITPAKLLLGKQKILEPTPSLGVSLSLSETPTLSCVRLFVVRILFCAQQRTSLPWAFYRAHGEEKHTVNSLFVVRFFLHTTKNEFAMGFFVTHNTAKYFSHGSLYIPNVAKKILCRVLPFDTWKTHKFVMCLLCAFFAHSKELLSIYISS
jgi:hypothetical protein